MLKKCIILILVIFIIYGANRGYYFLTDNFSIKNITPHISLDPYPVAQDEEVSNILNQKFYYLGKGGQSFVFQSEDQKYVLKFFKFQFLRPKIWPQYFTFLPFVKLEQDKSSLRRELRLNKLLTGYKLAFEELRQETGLIFLHFGKTDTFNATVTLFDKLHCEHQVDLSNLPFVLQKKAELVEQVIPKLVAMHQEHKALKLLRSLSTLLILRQEKNIEDSDPFFLTNLGVLEDRIIFIDPGQFRRGKNLHSTRDFEEWLSHEYPALKEQLIIYQ